MSILERYFRLSVLERKLQRWFGHAQRDSGYTGQRMLNVELPDRWKRETPQWRFMDVVKEALWMVAVTEEDFI